MTDPSNQIPRGPTSGDPVSTSFNLLERVKSQDEAAWARLISLYSPLVYRWCRRCDLQSSDASDVAQEVFRSVFTNIANFRRESKGDTFRGWLWTVTRNKIRDHLRRDARRPDAVGGSAIQQRLLDQPETNEEESSAILPLNDDHRLVRAALDLIRGEFTANSWTAFWRTAVEEHSVVEVAADLQITPAAVRQAKYRVLRRLRQEMGDLL